MADTALTGLGPGVSCRSRPAARILDAAILPTRRSTALEDAAPGRGLGWHERAGEARGPLLGRIGGGPGA